MNLQIRTRNVVSHRTLLVVAVFLFSVTVALASASDLNIEEQRIQQAINKLPESFKRLDTRLESFKSSLKQSYNEQSLETQVTKHAQLLWQDAVKVFSTDESFDDRSLYWTRLAMSKALKETESFTKLSSKAQKKLLWQFELLSRGQGDINFAKNSNKKILITGFDPFFLDRNIDQSNPSGAAALALDGQVLEFAGVSVEIESVVVPVRFADFDQGMIETLLAPYFKQVDMIVTISMGRTEFDLERFPGLRRSAKAPGNLNVYTGASSENPLIPLLNGQALDGPEFVEFSLPVGALQKAKGKYKIIDNHKVTTLKGKLEPAELSELGNEISVSGSGGGYLSNEISYRSIRLRNIHNPKLPVGHIHTPRIKAFEPHTTGLIIKQIRLMLTHAIEAL